LIEEAQESFDDSFTKYKYRITEHGRKIISQTTEKDGDFSEVVEYMKVRNWRALELAATVKFLQINEGFSDRGSAFQQAMKLKPATISFRTEAEQVLDKIC
jgi:hypothetical protein